MFTENWTGWYTEFGGAVPYRPVEDLAFSVARFIQNNVSFMNYYMHHGGTDFGRTATGLFIATSYDYDAPIDEYGLLREPKWGHLTNLHKAIKQCEPALVSLYPTVTWRGNNLEVHVFKTKLACAAFLANYDTNSPATVTFQNAQYYLSPWSVSILTDCKNAIFNTAKITASSYQPKMTPVSGQSIGRHWPEYKASGNCGACSYAGTFTEKKCRFNCKQSSQRWHHVPRSWLKASGNSLVVFDELGGIPTRISMVKRTF